MHSMSVCFGIFFCVCVYSRNYTMLSYTTGNGNCSLFYVSKKNRKLNLVHFFLGLIVKLLYTGVPPLPEQFVNCSTTQIPYTRQTCNEQTNNSYSFQLATQNSTVALAIRYCLSCFMFAYDFIWFMNRVVNSLLSFLMPIPSLSFTHHPLILLLQLSLLYE